MAWSFQSVKVRKLWAGGIQDRAVGPQNHRPELIVRQASGRVCARASWEPCQIQQNRRRLVVLVWLEGVRLLRPMHGVMWDRDSV